MIKYISENRIQEFEAQKSISDGEFGGKPIREVASVQILDLNDHLYFVTGADTIYLLGDEAGENWARLLTSEEIAELPVDIHWDGPTHSFETSSKDVTELSTYLIDLIVLIIEKYLLFQFLRL